MIQSFQLSNTAGFLDPHPSTSSSPKVSSFPIPVLLSRDMCSHVEYSECLTHKPSSCELSEMRMCTGRPVTQIGTHVRCAVVCVHRLQVAVLVSPVARHLCFQPRMSRNKCKSSGDVAGTAASPCVPAAVLFLLLSRSVVSASL